VVMLTEIGFFFVFVLFVYPFTRYNPIGCLGLFLL
jgi:hypothetical protein